MKKLLSLPPNLVECFHEVEKVERSEWFCTSDPVGSKLGSGGGTAWLLESCRKEWAPDLSLREWLGQDTRLLCSWDSPSKNTGVGCRALLQRLFLAQRWNQQLLGLLHCQGGFFTTSTT